MIFSNRTFIKRAISTILCIAFCFVLVGCAGNSGKAHEEKPQQSPVVEGTPALLAATPAPKPQRGGTLRLAMPENAATNDPIGVNTKEMLGFYGLIYESLITIEADGTVSPCLAENWSSDADGFTWTMNLRSTARWQDTGLPVSAADVVHTFSLITQGEGDGYYSYVLNSVESIEKGEGNSVIVKMKRPGITALYALHFPIVENPATASSQFGAGTGPYMVESKNDEKTVLKTNPNWWKEQPYIEKIEYYPRGSNEISIASYVAGQLDMVFTSSLSVGKHREDGVTNVYDVMTQNVEMLLFNFDNAELSNVLVRQGIAYAINRSEIITNVYMNRARECDVPIAPDNCLYDVNSKVYDYNREMALALFEQAGWADSDGDGYLEKNGSRYDELTLRLLVNKSMDSEREMAAGSIAAHLESIGIHTEIVSAGYALGDNNSEYMAKLENGEFDLALAGFNIAGDYDLLPYLARDGARNYGKYGIATPAELAMELNNARDDETCRAAASALQMAIVDQLPFITLYFRLSSIMYHASINGIGAEREPDLMANIAAWYILKS